MERSEDSEANSPGVPDLQDLDFQEYHVAQIPLTPRLVEEQVETTNPLREFSFSIGVKQLAAIALIGGCVLLLFVAILSYFGAVFFWSFAPSEGYLSDSLPKFEVANQTDGESGESNSSSSDHLPQNANEGAIRPAGKIIDDRAMSGKETDKQTTIVSEIELPQLPTFEREDSPVASPDLNESKVPENELALTDSLSKRIKNAIVTVNGRFGPMAGLLVAKIDKTGYVVVSDRIVEFKPATGTPLTCYFGHESRQVFSCECKADGLRTYGGLCILCITHENLPEPVDLESVASPSEGLAVKVLALQNDFYAGERLVDSGSIPEIPCSILKTKSDSAGVVERIQLSQLIDHRYSGGAVVDNDGKLVGIAFPSSIDNNGKVLRDLVVPQTTISTMLQGTVASDFGGMDKYNNPDGVGLQADLIDPYGRIQSVMAIVCEKESLPPDWNDRTPELIAGPGILSCELEIQRITKQPSAANSLKLVLGDKELFYQIQIKRSDGSTQCYPISKFLKDKPHFESKRFDWTAPEEVNSQTPPRPCLITSQANTVAQLGRFHADCESLLPFLAISSDNDHLFVGSKEGTIIAFSTEDRSEVARHVLSGPCIFFGLSKAGLVAVNKNAVTVLNTNNLQTIRKFAVADVGELACNPNCDWAYFLRHDDSKLIAISLNSGDVFPFEEKIDVELKFPVLSNDGRYLVAFNGRFDDCVRYRIDGNKLKLVQRTSEIHPSIRKVAMFSVFGHRALPVDNRQENQKSTPIPLDSFEQSASSTKTGEHSAPGFGVLDPVTDRIYGNRPESSNQPSLTVWSSQTAESTYSLAGQEHYRSRDDGIKTIIAHPKGNQVVVLTNYQLLSLILGETSNKSTDATSNSSEVNSAKSVVSIPLPITKELPNSSSVIRTWKDKSGLFEVDAKVVEVDQTGVVLLERANGSQVEIDLDQLSESDQLLINSMRR